MEDRADAVVARWSDPVNPLRFAWKQRVRAIRTGSDRISSVLAWQGRAVAPYVAGPGANDIGSIVDRDGTVIGRIPAPAPHTRRRETTGPAITWPDEGLVAGVHAERFELVWIDLEGGSQVVPTPLSDRTLANQPLFQLVPTSDGGVFVSTPVAYANLEGLGWTIDPRLDSLYGISRRSPFDDFEYGSELVTRAGRRWEAAGRVACVADDVAIFEEGSGAKRQIVARQVTDGGELWRRAAVDAFVLGSIPMPAWSDDRIYVLDRGRRRAQAWASETETARIHRVSADQPMRTLLSVRAVSRARDEQAITAPSVITCMSTRTGEALWHVDVDGDVVSFYCHTTWIAIVIAGEQRYRVWRHDGTPCADAAVDAAETTESSSWPPDAARWPCIAWGDDTHVAIAENRSKRQGGPRLYVARLEAPGTPRWEMPLPAPAVYAPQRRWLRLTNRVPMAFANDAAFLRWGKQLYGFLP